MKTTSLIYKLKKLFPKSCGYKKDFLGLQTGKLRPETKCVVICLDFDDDVFKKIKNKNVDLVITHHPLIYGKRHEVLKNDPIKKKLITKIDKINLPIYSFHTNFDCAPDGMNDEIAKKLHLKKIKTLKGNQILRGGELPKIMPINEFAKYVKKIFHLPYILLINKGKKKIKKVAICGGSGSSLFQIAQKEKYDIFCSGDVPHHIRHNINCYQYNFLELPHEVEALFIKKISQKIKKIDKNITVIGINNQKIPNLI